MNSDFYENLPKKLGIQKRHRSHIGELWYLDSDIWYIKKYWKNHHVHGVRPYKIALRVLKKYVNQAVEVAFSHYCTLAPKYHQIVFREILPTFPNQYHLLMNLYLDENNIIRLYSPEVLAKRKRKKLLGEKRKP